MVFPEAGSIPAPSTLARSLSQARLKGNRKILLFSLPKMCPCTERRRLPNRNGLKALGNGKRRFDSAGRSKSDICPCYGTKGKGCSTTGSGATAGP